MTRSLSSITTLAIVLFALVTYNFSGAWNPAPASPPNSNVAAPINVSGSPQAKIGNFGANRVDALVQMRSPEYCDAAGNNCWNPTSSGVTVPEPPICTENNALQWDGNNWICTGVKINSVSCVGGEAIIGISGNTAYCGQVSSAEEGGGSGGN